MKEIKYIMEGLHCKTICPYLNDEKIGEVRVGSIECNSCKYHISDNDIDTVLCGYEESADLVNSPDHYNQGAIECIDAIQAARGDEATKEFCICNAIKYLWRLGHKDEPVQEAKKAIWYINKYIELSEKK